MNGLQHRKAGWSTARLTRPAARPAASPVLCVAGLACALASGAAAGTAFTCAFDTECRYDTGCALLDAPIPLALEIGGDGGGAARFDNFQDSFTAAAAALPSQDTTRSFTLTGEDVVALITIHADGKANMAHHSPSDADYAALYAGSCRRP